jgi:hypothetical protein
MKAKRGASPVWHLDRDGRLSRQANAHNWRVVAADRDRVDPTADYLFCAPDFLFPAKGVARALRLEIDSRPSRRAGTNPAG